MERIPGTDKFIVFGGKGEDSFPMKDLWILEVTSGNLTILKFFY